MVLSYALTLCMFHSLIVNWRLLCNRFLFCKIIVGFFSLYKLCFLDIFLFVSPLFIFNAVPLVLHFFQALISKIKLFVNHLPLLITFSAKGFLRRLVHINHVGGISCAVTQWTVYAYSGTWNMAGRSCKFTYAVKCFMH